MGEDSGFAAVQVNLFEGTCYLAPLLGAWLADSLWGRYRTILVFSVVYFLVGWGPQGGQGSLQERGMRGRGL